VPGTNKQFLGLVFTALRLLPPTKSVTQAKRQHVLFGRCVLADIAFQALYIHFNIIAYWSETQSISFICAVFSHSEPKLATLKFLRRQKLPPTAVNQKHPGFGRFSPSPFERRFDFFLNRSVELKTRNLVA
jgi:hypothetical protein